MKILYYSPHPQLRIDAPTGYGTHIREMIAAWKRMGIEVRTLIAGDIGEEGVTASGEVGKSKFSPIKSLVPPLVWESVRDLSLQRFDVFLEKELTQAVEEFQPDFIYERVAYLQNSGIKIARKLKVKHIAEINAPYPGERISFSGKSFLIGAARNVEREILVHSTGITVVSSALKDHFVDRLPDAEPRIHVIPNAVNPDLVVSDRGTVESLKTEYKIDDELIVGFVGSIFPYHGVDILIEAFAKIPEDRRVRLLIVGDGSILADLKAQARSLGVFERIIFTGSLPHREVYPHIELMDICCMPKSNWYGSPVKIFEYALFSKPVIAPDVVPVRDVMSAEDGLLVEPEVLAFHKALLHLIDNPGQRTKFGENWNKKVLKNYTWDHAARNTLKRCT